MSVLTVDEYRDQYSRTRSLTRPPSPVSAVTIKSWPTSDACPTCGALPGEPGYFRSDFPPGHPSFGKLVRCPDCNDGNLAARLAGASQLGGWLKEATFSAFGVHPGNSDGYQAARAIVESKAGWLTLWGGYGVGKTHLLASVVNYCTVHRIAAVYYALPDLLDAMRGSYGESGSLAFEPTFARLCRLPVLALDELDKVRLTDWALEKMYQLFDARYRELERVATICASNTRPDPADACLGYLYSRMSDKRSKVVEIAGGDVRPLDLSAPKNGEA